MIPPVSIIVIGASGDLARKKIFPALFALFCQGLLPAHVTLAGFARRPMSDETFRNLVSEHLACRYTPGASCAEYRARFLARCFYVSGEYGSRDAFLSLYETIRVEEGDTPANRLYYMAIPPFIFMDVAEALGGAGLVNCEPSPAWSRVVIEKPFGRDRASSDDLVANMGQVFSEKQTFRIDHYLGKEIVQNLLVLRFANRIFDPIWNRTHIESVRIDWKEDLDVADRGGYFDRYGIVRDVVQNHLLQILALVAMEPPESLDARHIRDEKVKIIRSIVPVALEDLVLGQYRAAIYKGRTYRSYVDEPAVARDSRTPTYAATILNINNDRWAGVPFFVSAGKGLDERKTEIRIRFRTPAANLFNISHGALAANELVIRIQPDEEIYFQITNKAPGLDMKLVETALDLRYASTFESKIPDAYECLLLDVIRGDKSLFIRSDELAAAWDVFTPVLHDVECLALAPELYDFGSAGPSRARLE